MEKLRLLATLEEDVTKPTYCEDWDRSTVLVDFFGEGELEVPCAVDLYSPSHFDKLFKIFWLLNRGEGSDPVLWEAIASDVNYWLWNSANKYEFQRQTLDVIYDHIATYIGVFGEEEEDDDYEPETMWEVTVEWWREDDDE